jgi:hypothetical protein
VPLEAGTLRIEPVAFPYFDPATGRYETTATKAFELSVAPAAKGTETLLHVGAAGQGPAAAKEDVKVVGSDLMPTKVALSELHADTLSGREKLGLLLLVAAAALLYAAVLVKQRWGAARSDDRHAGRRSRAFRTFRRGLDALSEGRAFFEQASRLLRHYLGDRFGLDGTALTPGDLAAKLSRQGLSPAVINGLQGFLKTCDAAIYGGADALKEAEAKKDLIDLVKRVEKEAR